MGRYRWVPSGGLVVYNYDLCQTQVEAMEWLDGGPAPWRGVNWEGLLRQGLVAINMHPRQGCPYTELTEEGRRVLREALRQRSIYMKARS